MLTRMLGNRFKKIERRIKVNDPRKIVLRDFGDLTRLYDNIEKEKSFLENKLIYYDLGFFRGNRKLHKLANESRDIFFIWNKKKYGAGDAENDSFDDRKYDDDAFYKNNENNYEPEAPLADLDSESESESESKRPDEPETSYKPEYNDEHPEGNSEPEIKIPGIRKCVPPCGSFD